MEKATNSEANHQSVEGLGVAAPDRQLQDVQTDSLRSWLVVLGSFCTLTCTFGAVSSYGVFQAHYKSSLLSEYSASQISWIGAIQYFLLFFLGLPAGYLADIGYTRHLMVTGSVIVIVSQLCISWCAKYWQFLLVQGIIYGIGCGSLFTPACAVVQPWFEKRRGLALGVIACGAAVGGVICSIVSSSLLPRIGFSWACRVLALLFFVLLSVSCAVSDLQTVGKLLQANSCEIQLIKPYPMSMGTNIDANDFDAIATWGSWLRNTFPAIFEPAFILYLCGLFCATAGVYLPFNFLQQYVGDIGLSGSYSKYMTAYINASSILGRLGGGILADKYVCFAFDLTFIVVKRLIRG
ncbi:unnamed protein product [Clonostachys solani]|uniref:Major facilitator superfamily (MFS) profile domain-containing protein n=1 Tax=Clonostachys solani TaxID=160281 RepID=A0A9N9W5C5_9HYPO|nr:unnamed protein product [Clonostachys solani]